jgi:hypothetical protein
MPDVCECCVSVHERAEHPLAGYLIGRDGEYELVLLLPSRPTWL